ncbi:hypothetical protein G3565_34125, partial [Escherichia coli]|nr:hypothetical protein [Escherichia coli]
PAHARVLQLANGEAPADALATNYSLIARGDAPRRVPPRSPYGFMQVRIDWTADALAYWINANRTRRVVGSSVPAQPQTLSFAHWSTG